MTKHTIGVYQAYKNSGNLRFHKSNTKKHWKHYFIEVDDYDEEEYSFGSDIHDSSKRTKHLGFPSIESMPYYHAFDR